MFNQDYEEIDSTFLSNLLKQLKKVLELFKQKQQYGLLDLKIYLGGLLLNGPASFQSVSGNKSSSNVTDLKTAIQFIVENSN